jgi:hypothetical protein
VGWLPPLALLMVAAILGYAAWATHRMLQRPADGARPVGRLLPHQAVNRLVLAKSCALTGAVVAGGYLGYALSWVGAEAELARERILLSLLAAGGAALTTVGALLLERACRVRDEDAAH